MPNVSQHWSSCLEKDDDRWSPDWGANKISALIGSLLVGFVAGFAPAAILAVVGMALGAAGLEGCIGGAWFLGGLVAFFFNLIHWYDNERLRCMEHDACAIGTVVHRPHSNGNGDLDIDLALAPFSPDEQRDALAAQMKLQHGKSPPGSVMTYIEMAAMTAAARLNLFWYMVGEQYLKWPANRRFQEKYFNSTSVVDTIFADNKKAFPVYRCPSDTRDEAEKWPLPSPITADQLENMYVYLPCVIEGHVIVEWLKNLRNGFIAALAGFIAACIVCAVLTLGAGAVVCGPIAAAVAAILGFLAWLVSHLLNDPEDSRADGGTPSGSNAPGEPAGVSASVERGDIALVFGTWVLFPYQNGYYEIHPVTAWYLICRGSRTDDSYRLSGRECVHDMSRLLDSDYERMCRMVREAESVAPSEPGPRSIASALSVSAGLH